MKKRMPFVLILLGLVLGGWAGYYYWQGTPRCSLYQMAKAIKNNDPQTFLRYVDMDQVLEGIVNSTIEEMRKKISPNSGSAASAQEDPSHKNKELKDMVARLAQSLKPALEQQVIRAIRDIEQKDRISPFAFAFLSQVKQEGNKAQVMVRASKKDTYQCTLEKTPERSWKIVRLDVDFFKLYKKARKHKE
ncbi:MAG TPA: DUF2939 domain-containing protein [Thermodesulfobacteriota bacterium]|nr:DUF2939 domain-containing protein [Thermodesulfobacteriota bacterium]